MNKEQIKKALKYRDRTVRVLSQDGHFRAVASKTTATTSTAQKKHGLDYLPSLLLSRLMTSATMMASFLKGEERISLEMQSKGPVKRVFAESLQVGESRGFLEFNEDASEKRIDKLKDAFEAGVLVVSKIFYNKSEPIQGIVPIQNGDISSDLAYYYSQSEQIPTAVILDVEYDDNERIISSGGLMVQAMPDSTKEEIDELYENLMQMKDLAKLFREENSPQDVMKKVLPFDFKEMNNSPVDFYCRCSKDAFIDKLVTLHEDEIKGMQEDGQNELVCRYCNEHYYLDDSDFDKILQDIRAKKN